jgi:hypothetical protein
MRKMRSWREGQEGHARLAALISKCLGGRGKRFRLRLCRRAGYYPQGAAQTGESLGDSCRVSGLGCPAPGAGTRITEDHARTSITELSVPYWFGTFF